MLSENQRDRVVTALMGSVGTLACDGLSGDETTGESTPWILRDLEQVNEAIAELCRVRDAIVQRLRADECAWSAIASATGVPISTWRRRHARQPSV